MADRGRFERERARQLRVDELAAGDLVHLYGTVVEVTAPWYVPGDGMTDGWGRLPVIWNGLACAPPEQGDRVVRLAGEEDPRVPGVIAVSGPPLPRRIRGASCEYVIDDRDSPAPGIPGGVIRVVLDEAAELYGTGGEPEPGMLARLAVIIRRGRKP